jgi:hypothetical protein
VLNNSALLVESLGRLDLRSVAGDNRHGGALDNASGKLGYGTARDSIMKAFVRRMDRFTEGKLWRRHPSKTAK